MSCDSLQIVKALLLLLLLIGGLSSCQPEERKAPQDDQKNSTEKLELPPGTRDEQLARLREINHAFQITPTSPVPIGVLLSKEDVQVILAALREVELRTLAESDTVTLQQALFLGETSDGSSIDQMLLDRVRQSMTDQPYRTMLLQIIDAREKLGSE